jgi:hypothetical protein
MLDSDKRQFQEIILGTAELYSTAKKIEVTPVMMKLFFSSLRNYSIEQVSYGFEQHLNDPNDGKFFPKPANISKHLQSNAPSSEDKALLAWSVIEGSIARIGSYGSLKMEDKQALATLKAIGGWKDLCQTDVVQMQWKRKEFISVYETYDRTPIELLPNNLPGIVAIEQHKAKDATQYDKLVDGVNKFRLANNMPELDKD